MSDQPSEPTPAGDRPATSGHNRLQPQHNYGNDSPINRVMIAGLLVMAGVVLLADQLHLLPSYNGANSWAWIALGAGVVFLLTEMVRGISGDAGRGNSWTLIAGIGCLGFGASAIFGVSWELLWPAGVILAGIVLLSRSLGGH